MTEIKMLPDKALIYATNKRGLLIFEEPDFPDVPPQVPGGTIDENEEPIEAAKREFAEETGLRTPFVMSFICLDQHRFERDGLPCQINRYYYHTAVPDDLPETWDHYEQFAHEGAEPILFRFSWITLDQALRNLGIGMEAAIPELQRLRAEIP